MDSYNSETIFYIPGAFSQPAPLLGYLIMSYKENREMFCDNIKLGCLYGSPASIWNGGHYIDIPLSLNELKEYQNVMYNWMMPIRFTFSNCLLEEQHLLDNYANQIVEIFANGYNEIICNSNILEQYLRDNYGNKYKFISSTTKYLENTNKQLELLNNNNYFLVVLDIDKNKDFEFLNQIPNKSKVELLCNSTCKDNCPNKVEHYKSISRKQLNYGFIPEEQNAPYNNCVWSGANLSERMIHKNFITPEEINDIYLPLGFNHFKLEGRCAFPLIWMETMAYYLIKDEYKMKFREDIYKIIYTQHL